MKIFRTIGRIAVFLFVPILVLPTSAAQPATARNEDGAAYLGSLVLSLLHFPFKLATCAATQTA